MSGPGFSSKVEDLAEPLRSELGGLLTEAGGRVSIGNGCRSTDKQFELRGTNGCRGREYDRSCKGSPLTAIPGSSRHEDCLAADLTGDLALAHRLAPRYNLHFPVPGENWHIESMSPGGKGPGKPLGSPSDPAGPSSSSTGAKALAGGGIVGGTIDGIEKLTDPHTWYRVFLVVAGLGALVAGSLVVMGDSL